MKAILTAAVLAVMASAGYAADLPISTPSPLVSVAEPPESCTIWVQTLQSLSGDEPLDHPIYVYALGSNGVEYQHSLVQGDGYVEVPCNFCPGRICFRGTGESEKWVENPNCAEARRQLAMGNTLLNPDRPIRYARTR